MYEKYRKIYTKNHTHEKKVAHTSEFLLVFIDELENQIIIKKTVEVGKKKFF